MIKKQQGFTLIELMIALALGLIITAAAVGIYIANHRTLANQKSGSEMQSASLFGIQPLEARLRMANLGNDSGAITSATQGGGIVLTTANANTSTQLTANHLSKSGDGSSNTGTASDQLTIQFTNVTPTPIYDCEGNIVNEGVRTIERYYVRQTGTNAHDLSLVCDAGTFTGNQIALNGSNGFGGTNGAVLIGGIDQFRVMLGTQTINNNDIMTRYYTIDDYNDITGDKPPIVSIKAGVIARGTTPISISEGLTDFSLFGATESLKDNVPKGFVRNTYETTTLLRNARAITFDSSDAVEVK